MWPSALLAFDVRMLRYEGCTMTHPLRRAETMLGMQCSTSVSACVCVCCASGTGAYVRQQCLYKLRWRPVCLREARCVQWHGAALHANLGPNRQDVINSHLPSTSCWCIAKEKASHRTERSKFRACALSHKKTKRKRGSESSDSVTHHNKTNAHET